MFCAVDYVTVLVLVGALFFGMAIGGWRSLVAAVIAGVWVGFTHDGEMADWFAGVLTGVIVAVPTMAGALARKAWGKGRILREP
jgi:hypothetical protein